MIEFKLLTELSELEELIEFFAEGFAAMEKRRKVFEMGWEGFVRTLVGVLNSTPHNGIVVVYENGVPKGYGVAYDNTPEFADRKILLLWALYVRPEVSKVLAPLLFSHACELAKQQGYDEVIAFNSRFSGASFRFFEKELGMHRNRIQFSKSL